MELSTELPWGYHFSGLAGQKLQITMTFFYALLPNLLKLTHVHFGSSALASTLTFH